MAFKTKINCPICRGEARLTKTTTKLFDGLIVLKDDLLYKCTKCGEKFATGKMVDESMKKAKKVFNFNRQIISTGGSLAITLPSDLSAYYNLEKGGKIKLIPKSKREISVIVG